MNNTLLYSFILYLSFSVFSFCADSVPERNRATPESESRKNAVEEEKDDTDALAEYERMASVLGMEKEEKKGIFYYRCRHIRSKALKELLDDFVTSGGTVGESEESDIVVVSDVESNLKKLKEIAEHVDQPVPQILVEARIVELTLDNDFEKEVNVAFQHFPLEQSNAFVKEIVSTLLTPGAGAHPDEGAGFSVRPWAESYGGKRNLLTTFIRYLETKGRAKILSAPNLVLRRGVEGSIVTGEEVPILTQTVVSGSISTSTVFKSVGIKLKVRPVMIADGRVRLTISPEVSTVTGYTTSGPEGIANPIIAVRNAQTELEVVDGELISIGGLLRNEEREQKKKVPVLGSVPVLGHLFRGTRKESVQTQLIIFLNIRILEAGESCGVRIHRPSEIPLPIRDEIEQMDRASQKPFADIHSDIQNLRDGE